jgi:hypothetical protein
MNKHFFTLIFLLGATALAWVGNGFLGTHALALVVTLVIAAVYGFGAFELHRFRQATARLGGALAAIPEPLAQLGDWLNGLPVALQNPVRLRIEGERVGLPGPALTPYLVGLLVMLGMLGTFLGMVATLNGAVFALEGTSDLAAIRTAFAVPIKGLGLAFGTSVAGVASSAMLGLMSALSRRERMQTAQLLDTKIATVLRGFSLTHQRQETFKALQLQSRALPAVMDQLQAMMAQMERMGLQHHERLLANQERFHSGAQSVYSALARSVEQSLQSSLVQAAQAAGQSITPVVQSAMSGIADEARSMHERMVATMQMQLQTLASGLRREWQQAGAQTLAQQQQVCDALARTAQEVAASTQSSAHSTLAEIQRLLASTEELASRRLAAESLRGQAAVDRLDALQAAVAQHLTSLGQALEAPIARLIQTASEAPRAAAEVIGSLRQELSNSMARDNELLDERRRILETLSGLLDSIHHASQEQRAVIDTLVASSAQALHTAGGQFADKVNAEADKLADIAAHVTSSAVEVSSLGQAFGFAVGTFSEANDKLIANLQRIEAAMDKSMARSDDQLAYYVAQAREVIDLSIMSQKEIVEELRQLGTQQALLAQEAA